MKTVGLIGGMSWESSAEYYHILNETVNEKLGSLNSCRCIMYSVNFQDIQQANWDEILQMTIDAAKKVETAGADMLLMCANSMHKIAEDVQQHINIPLIHITDATAKKIKAARLHKVGLLGTKLTMEQDFYKGRLKEKFNIEVDIPNSEERKTINDIIFEELTLGIIKQSSKDRLKEIIKNLILRGAEGIILGCTEIPLIIKEEDSDVIVFNTTRIHAMEAIELALNKE